MKITINGLIEDYDIYQVIFLYENSYINSNK